MYSLSLLLLFAGPSLIAATGYGSSQKCAALGASLSIPNAKVQIASFVPAGTNLTFPQGKFPGVPLNPVSATCTRPFQVVTSNLCRIALHVATSEKSETTVEVWLPDSWTGRFLVTGNGGLSGCVFYEDMNYNAQLGFAAVGTNNGHNGTSGLSFYNNTEVVADFAYRSIHVGAVVGKQVTKAYYGKAHTKSYYVGCSTGGRQGLKSAQDFPEDFDGIVAGAAASDFNNLTSWSGHFYSILGPATAPSFVSTALWATIHTEILNQCDGIDGVVDGIIEDPSLCNFRPEALQCPPGQTESCLTSAQVVAVRAVFDDYHGVGGTLIYPRMQPGSELTARNVYYNGKPFIYTSDWFRYAIYNNPSWDPAAQTVQDAAYAAAKDPYKISTWNGDLTPFKKRGGRLITFHGLEDPIISSDNSARYYNHVSSTMSLPSSSLDQFYRYFRIAGMGHCAGGAGAGNIGQNARGSAGVKQDNDHSVVMQIVSWVEKGHAPEGIIGTKFVNDTVALGVDFQRKHCKYPKRNFCINPKKYKDPKSWKCI